jgi:hypothetical protein
LHTRWRSVRQEDAEQCGNCTKTPAKAAIRGDKKIFYVFDKRRRTIERAGGLTCNFHLDTATWFKMEI